MMLYEEKGASKRLRETIKLNNFTDKKKKKKKRLLLRSSTFVRFLY